MHNGISHANSFSCKTVSVLKPSLAPLLKGALVDDFGHRTHHQRTRNYIKTLESKVIRLRGLERDLISENKRLSNQVGVLRAALILASVLLPAGFPAK